MLKSKSLRNEVEINHTSNYWNSFDGLKMYSQIWMPIQPAIGVITLIHGMFEHGGRYAHWASALAVNGFIVEITDLRGHGRSEGKRGFASNYQNLIKDLDLIVNRNQTQYPNLPHFLYGHSMGGNLVLNYSISKSIKIKGLIVTSPWLELTHKPDKLKLLVAKAVCYFAPWVITRVKVQVEDISRDLKATHLYRTDPLIHQKMGIKMGIELLEAGLKASRSIYKINMPLLVMHGNADKVTSCKTTREFVMNASNKTQYVEWEGGYHELHNDIEKEKVFENVLEWLNRNC